MNSVRTTRTLSRTTAAILVTLLTTFAVAQTTPSSTEPTTAPSAIDDLPAYQHPDPPIAGTVTLGGSGTMMRFMQPMLKAFAEQNPDITHNDGVDEGSNAVPGALEHGVCNVGLMSRPMSRAEKAAYKQSKGHEPAEFTVAFDAIEVLVNKDNPIDHLTLRELDGIFGTERRAGLKAAPAKWSDLGVDGPLADTPIVAYGIKEEQQGTVEAFRHLVCLDGPLNQDVKASRGPIGEKGESVAGDPAGIVYAVSADIDPGAKKIALAEGDDAKAALPTAAAIADGSYPLVRPLYIYMDDTTETTPDEFLRFIFSREGQAIVEKSGANPINGIELREQLAKLK